MIRIKRYIIRIKHLRFFSHLDLTEQQWIDIKCLRNNKVKEKYHLHPTIKRYQRSHNLVALIIKADNLLLEEDHKMYAENFLRKPIEVDYYVNKVVESEIKINFLQFFDNHKLLKFIGPHKKFDVNNVNDFYAKVKVTKDELKCKFCGKLIEFTREDFKAQFGLEFKGIQVCVSNAQVSTKLIFSE
ncbi:hypothetical protein RYX36_037072 [Vicia faba]